MYFICDFKYPVATCKLSSVYVNEILSSANSISFLIGCKLILPPADSCVNTEHYKDSIL